MKNYKIVKFNLDGKNLELKFIKNPKKTFIASTSNFGVFNLGYISIENTFFNKFTAPQRKAIIYHELWHYKNNLKFEIRILFSKSFLAFFFHNKLCKLQEIEADKYSAKINKKNALSALIKIKELIEKENLPYSLKNHPSIGERIKRIKELK